MEYIAVILLIVIGGAFIFYFLKSSNKTVTINDKGLILLKIHIISKIVGIMSIIVTGALVILAIFTVETTEDLLSAIILIVLFLFLGLFLVLFGFNYRVEADEQTIVCYSLFNKSSRMLWENVKDVKLRGAFVILSGDNGAVKVFIRLVGFVNFAEVASRKLDETLYNKSFKRLFRYGINVVSKTAESAESVEYIENKVRKEMSISRSLKSGANWFYWIAGLSIINTVIILFNGNINFVAGLGITQIVNEIAFYISDSLGLVAVIGGIAIDVIFAGIFVLFGVMANKGRKWSFIIGMILYGLDTIIFILNKDFIGVSFHLFALFGIYNGFKAIDKTMN